MTTYSTVCTRETPGGRILDAWEIYRGPSLGAAIQLRHFAVQRLIRAFGWPFDAPRPQLAVRVLARGGSPRGADFEIDRFVLPEVSDPSLD